MVGRGFAQSGCMALMAPEMEEREGLRLLVGYGAAQVTHPFRLSVAAPIMPAFLLPVLYGYH